MTKKYLLLSGFAAFILLIAGIIVYVLLTVEVSETIEGDGNITEEKREVQSFNQILVENSLKVYYARDDEFSIRVVADENLLEYIQTEVNEGQLTVTTPKNLKSDNLVIEVLGPDLSKIKTQARGGFYAHDTLRAENIEIKATTESRIELLGQFGEMDLTVDSGARANFIGRSNVKRMNVRTGSEADLYRFESDVVHVNVENGGIAKVHALQQISATGSGDGRIYYRGNPDFDQLDFSSGAGIDSRP